MSDPATPNTTIQRSEVEANFAVFQGELPSLLGTDRNRFAIYRQQKRIAIMDTFADALIYVRDTGGFPASVQEITDRVECCYTKCPGKPFPQSTSF
jgi:hypothetical protein